MKKAILIFSVLILISCKDEKQRLGEIEAEVKSLDAKAKSTLIDTVFFSEKEQLKWNDFALIYILDKKYDKDSVYTANFKIDFKNGDRLIGSSAFRVRGVDQNEEWSAGLELDSVASPLKRLDYGYPACGYTQYHFLFYVDGKNTKLVHEWNSGSDSGWGTFSGIVSGKPEDFYFRTESFLPDEDENGGEEMGINEFSDSIHFKLENKKWKKTYLTPKGKVYRRRKLTFNQYNKQD